MPASRTGHCCRRSHPAEIRRATILRDVRTRARFTGGALTALAVLLAAWGRRSAFTSRSRREPADAVVGSSLLPPPMACFAVAGAMAAGAPVVANTIPLPAPIRRASLLARGAVYGFRGALGFLGRTALISSGSNSERFVRLDQRLCAPMCLGLSTGSAASTARPALAKEAGR